MTRVIPRYSALFRAIGCSGNRRFDFEIRAQALVKKELDVNEVSA